MKLISENEVEGVLLMNDDVLYGVWNMLAMTALVIMMLLIVLPSGRAETLSVSQNVSLVVVNGSVVLTAPGQIISTSCQATESYIVPISLTLDYTPTTVVTYNSSSSVVNNFTYPLYLNVSNCSVVTQVVNVTNSSCFVVPSNFSVNASCDYSVLALMYNQTFSDYDYRIRGYMIDRFNQFSCPGLNFTITDLPLSQQAAWQEKVDNVTKERNYYSDQVQNAQANERVAVNNNKPLQDQLAVCKADGEKQNMLFFIVLAFALLMVLIFVGRPIGNLMGGRATK